MYRLSPFKGKTTLMFIIIDNNSHLLSFLLTLLQCICHISKGGLITFDSYRKNEVLTMEKVLKIEKDSVQETLMLPLYGKVMAMQMWPTEFHDEDCLRFKEMIDYDFSAMQEKMTGLYGKIAALSTAYRQFALAVEIKNYLKDHPKAVIVLMGCGLDTVGHQADNGQCTFVNVDFPNVIETREKLLPSTGREKNVACDLNDYRWFEEVGFERENGAVFIASGVFMYFKKTEVAALFKAMGERFPGAAVSFDAQNAKGAAMDLKALKDSGIDISLNFSLEASTAEKTLREMCPSIDKVKIKGMVYPYKDPKPFGIIFRLMAKYSDKGMGMIDTFTFQK